MKWLKTLFVHDFERDGPTYYNPRQRGFSLLKCMMMWVGLNLCIDVVIRALGGDSINSNVQSNPWVILVWMSCGAIFWWVDKILYASWLAKRRETSLRKVGRVGIERRIHP